MMRIQLVKEIEQQNPWLLNQDQSILSLSNYRKRLQLDTLLQQDWDKLWTILIGPRQAGKTTLGKYLCQELINQRRYQHLLYLNCDLLEIREWLKSPLFIQEAIQEFHLKDPIVFIDEVQRLPTPGLLLKTIADLNLPIKMLASGSSQLEIKSKVQEYLTGRHFSSLVLPLSYNEWDASHHMEELLTYGAYPQIIDSRAKEILLGQLYQDYIAKDIVEFLKLNQPDAFQKLLGLVAHSSSQLVNYNQLASDCQVGVHTIRHFLSVCQQTYVLAMLTPFVGNKRSELTSNPILYFIDNGFRNFALRNFNSPLSRSDLGLLVQSLVFQEIYKFITQNFLNLSLHYWRTRSGAEVDFVVYKDDSSILPIEVKYRNLSTFQVSRSYRSFLQAYQPKTAIIITKDLIGTRKIEETDVHFIALERLGKLFEHIQAL